MRRAPTKTQLETNLQSVECRICRQQILLLAHYTLRKKCEESLFWEIMIIMIKKRDKRCTKHNNLFFK